MELSPEKIVQGSKVEVNGATYEVLSKVVYIAGDKLADDYIKMMLTDDHVLAIGSSEGNSMQFGKIVEALPYSYPTPDGIEYEGQKYQKTSDGYQMVKEFVFGDPLTTEGEVRFTDYESQNDPDMLISTGEIVRTGERADVVLRKIKIDDVKIL